MVGSQTPGPDLQALLARLHATTTLEAWPITNAYTSDTGQMRPTTKAYTSNTGHMGPTTYGYT